MIAVKPRLLTNYIFASRTKRNESEVIDGLVSLCNYVISGIDPEEGYAVDNTFKIVVENVIEANTCNTCSCAAVPLRAILDCVTAFRGKPAWVDKQLLKSIVLHLEKTILGRVRVDVTCEEFCKEMVFDLSGGMHPS